jgi:hypothetical protein
MMNNFPIEKARQVRATALNKRALRNYTETP